MTPRPRLLIVDDDELMRMMLADMLSDACDVVCAASGEEALQVCAAERPAAVLLDVELPGIDGYETCRRLKAAAATAEIPIFFVSGHADEAAQERGRAAGAAGWLSKPFRPQEIELLVRPRFVP